MCNLLHRYASAQNPDWPFILPSYDDLGAPGIRQASGPERRGVAQVSARRRVRADRLASSGCASVTARKALFASIAAKKIRTR
jgi:hypothetical protein